jgi:hypothetical protein
MKLKILAAADIHGDSSTSRKLAEKAVKEKVDLVLLCGDLTMFNRESKNIIKPFVDKKLKLLLIPGNHDSFATAEFFAEFYGVKNIHGYSAQYKDVGFFGCGGTDLGLTKMTEKQISSTLEKAHNGIKGLKKKIMVTHMHPSGSKAEFTGILGSKSIRKAVERFKPDFILSGHIHEAEGIEEKIGNTTIINVGRKGKIIEI